MEYDGHSLQTLAQESLLQLLRSPILAPISWSLPEWVKNSKEIWNFGKP